MTYVRKIINNCVFRGIYEQKYKQPHEVDWSYWDEKNLQTLCRKCHKEKTKKDMENLREFNEKNT